MADYVGRKYFGTLSPLVNKESTSKSGVTANKSDNDTEGNETI
jgi:hypothetical protein